MGTKIEQLAIDKKELRRRRGIKAGIVLATIVMTILLLVALFAVINAIGAKAILKLAKSYSAHAITPRYEPEKRADGSYSFTMKKEDKDKPFKVLQLTDVHIGAGFGSFQKDKWALNAVATMIKREQPDLVTVTGDIAYPVPIQSGTANNLKSAEIFANLMESMGAYWTFSYGNHDTEAYSRYTRKDISNWYKKKIESGEFKHCLFTTNPKTWNKYTKNEDEFGYGNQVFRINRTANDGKEYLDRALTILDSHSYLPSDKMGMLWHYDNIHKAQINWYADTMEQLKAETQDKKYPKNLAFFHIALPEYKEAYDLQMRQFESGKDKSGYKVYKKEKGAYVKDGKFHYADGTTENVPEAKGLVDVTQEGINKAVDKPTVNAEAHMKEGIIGERKKLIYSGVNNDEFFETAAKYNLRGTFCGHDHYNNMSISYKKELKDADGHLIDYKPILLNYGMSIDYLAYTGIYKKGSQRGCRVIELNNDDNYGFITYNKNYYSYQPLDRNRERNPKMTYNV